MGVILGVETSTGEDIPHWFMRTDSKSFIYHLINADDVNKLARHFALDLTRLHQIADREEEPLDSFLARDPTEDREQYWMEMHAHNEAAWQSPKVLLAVLAHLLEALDNNRTVYEQLSLTDDYFTMGSFWHDVKDLHQMIAWADQRGIEKIRLVIG
jgi:hypothetical protein